MFPALHEILNGSVARYGATEPHGGSRHGSLRSFGAPQAQAVKQQRSDELNSAHAELADSLSPLQLWQKTQFQSFTYWPHKFHNRNA